MTYVVVALATAALFALFGLMRRGRDLPSHCEEKCGGCAAAPPASSPPKDPQGVSS